MLDVRLHLVWGASVLRCSLRCFLIALSAAKVRQIGMAIHEMSVRARSSTPRFVGAAPSAATRKSSELKSVVIKKSPRATPVQQKRKGEQQPAAQVSLFPKVLLNNDTTSKLRPEEAQNASKNKAIGLRVTNTYP